MSGKRSRDKGANFEREVANLLKSRFPDAKRGLGQARAANEVPDVTGTPYWIECKRHKRVSIQAAFEQAVEAAKSATKVAVVSKDDRGRVLVTISLDQWLRLIGDCDNGVRW